MKINLPVNLLHPALLAAALLSAGAGLVFGYANYNDCRCNQGAPYADDTANKTNCCSVTTSSWYASNSSKCKTPCPATCANGMLRDTSISYSEDGACCSCASYTVCKAGVGGYVAGGPTVATNCANCCGSGFQGIPGAMITCNGNPYNPCTCKSASTTVKLIANAIQLSDSTGCGDSDAEARQTLGISPATGSVARCTKGGYTGGHDAIFNDTYNTCMSEFGTLINQYIAANSTGFSGICYIGGGNYNPGSGCNDMGTKYYLGCVVK